MTVEGAVTAGVVGAALTTTVVWPGADIWPTTVAVTLYVPAFAATTPGIDGFWREDVKPFGPVHAYVAPAMVDAVRSRVWVVQSGPLFPATGGAGPKDVIVRTAPLADWPSGFVIVTVFIPVSYTHLRA